MLTENELPGTTPRVTLRPLEELAEKDAEIARLRTAIEAGAKALQQAAADMVGYAANPTAFAEPLQRAAEAGTAMRAAIMAPQHNSRIKMETPKSLTLAELKKPNPMNLDLGALRKLLAQHPDLPDDTPVVYQRIEDQYFTEQLGWSVVMLPWQSWPFNPKLDAESLAELEKTSPPGTFKVVDRAGEKYVLEYGQYVSPCGAYLAKDEEGNEALCLHAHY